MKKTDTVCRWTVPVIYLESLGINAPRELTDEFPFSLPVIEALDEPETPLSPIHQLSLLSLIMNAVGNDCQFIIATHSPLMMALPGATILSFDPPPICSIAWDEVEHVTIMRAFLNDPKSYLRHL